MAKGELDTRAMLQQLEKKQCEVSTIWETTELYKKHTADRRARILGRIGIACSMAPKVRLQSGPRLKAVGFSWSGRI